MRQHLIDDHHVPIRRLIVCATVVAGAAMAACGDTAGDQRRHPGSTQDPANRTTTSTGVPNTSTTAPLATSQPGATPGRGTDVVPPGGTAEPRDTGDDFGSTGDGGPGVGDAGDDGSTGGGGMGAGTAP